MEGSPEQKVELGNALEELLLVSKVSSLVSTYADAAYELSTGPLGTSIIKSQPHSSLK